MDYSKQNNEKKRKKIRSNAAKSKKKITFNIFRFTMLAILLIVIVGIAAAIGGFKGVIDSAPDITASNVMDRKRLNWWAPNPIERLCRSMIFPSAFQTPL